ncbi:MAG TPA: PAS domain-containing sensor histidine kinase [Candidatus Acidoferrales bacterium]|jgi:PAS domain S-box-containing protein|nr:PAS domain-containing sensor histidine kinase [Candidatus Acidoferrales bacterium]
MPSSDPRQKDSRKPTVKARKKNPGDLLELVHDAIIVRDAEGTILYWNCGAERMYGWSASEARGHISHEFLKTEFPESLEEMRKTLSRTGAWEGEVTQRTKDNSRLLVESRQAIQPDGNGGAGRILEVNRNITARREAEESLRNLSARLLQLQDEERRRIARELHDTTGQSLAALAIHLSAVNERIAAKDPVASEILREALQLSQEASNQTRTLSYLLYPPTLDFSGLKSALEWFADGFTQRSKIKVNLDLSLGGERVPQSIETALFRIVQESLTNMYRHSGGTEATVRGRRQDNTVSLEISDNGKGMPADLLASLSGPGGQVGVGIRGMKERARQLGGRLRIKSGEAGTTIMVVLPIPDSSPEDEYRAQGLAPVTKL